MMIKYIFISAIILLPLNVCYADGDTIIITAEVDKAFITIGDKISYTVTITHDPGIKILSTIAPPSLDEFEIRDTKEHDTFVNEDGDTVVGKKFILTTFRLGEYVFEGQSVEYSTSSGEKKVMYANNLYVTVESIAGEEGVETDIRGIKDVIPIEPSYTYLFMVIPLVLLIVISIMYLLRKMIISKGRISKSEVNVSLLPHEQAYRELEALPYAKVVHGGRIEKEYYSRISEIIKHYLSRRFNIDTIDRTTIEMVNLIKGIHISDTARYDIQTLLTMCDIVKFAKYRPQIDDILNHYNLTKEIVDKTLFVDEK